MNPIRAQAQWTAPAHGVGPEDADHDSTAEWWIEWMIHLPSCNALRVRGVRWLAPSIAVHLAVLPDRRPALWISRLAAPFL